MRVVVRSVVLLVVISAIAAAPAHAATPSTVTLRGDATHDNRVTGAPEPPLLARYRERTPDPWGRASAVDPRCGAKRLRLPAPAPARAWAATASQLQPGPTATARFSATL